MFNLVLDNIVGKREIELNKMSSFIARTVPHCKKKERRKIPTQHSKYFYFENTHTEKTSSQIIQVRYDKDSFVLLLVYIISGKAYVLLE